MHELESEVLSREPLSRREMFASVKRTQEFANLYGELSNLMYVPHTDAQMLEIQGLQEQYLK